MDALIQALGHDWSSLQPGFELWQALQRLLVASVLGGVLGFERELDRRPAGFRTHMLVTIGAALFVLAVVRSSGTSGDLSRVVQGVATGIGFIGAGAIMKRDDLHQIHGLTTAASIWIATAIGIAAGLGRFDIAIAGTISCWLVLSAFKRVEVTISQSVHPPPNPGALGREPRP